MARRGSAGRGLHALLALQSVMRLDCFLLPSPLPRASLSMSASTTAAPPLGYNVALVALGCPKNLVDAEVMLGDLQRQGCRIVPEPADADVIIVNTCAFVEDAKAESIAAIVEAGQLKSDRSVAARGLFVTGCLAQRYAEELSSELPEVDAIVGFESYSELPEQIMRTLGRSAVSAASSSPSVLVGSPTVPFRPETDRWQLTAPHFAYVRVAEGCDHSCTFCAIPGFRGGFRSKPFDVVVAEAERLVENGVRELVLIAEDTNVYGSDWGDADSRRLSDLLKALSELPQLRWIRLLYCYPSYFSEELIDAIASIDKVVKYIDMPLQHLSPSVLKRMQRPGGHATRKLVEKLRDRIPGLVLRSTFISGFPGESEAEHRELVEIAAALRFERGGAFAYSQEDGTPAAEYEGQLDEQTKKARRDEISALFEAQSRAWAEAQVGQTLRVMVDAMDGLDAVARTEFDAPDIDARVLIPSMPLAAGTELNVKVFAVDGTDLIAEPVIET